MDALKSLSDSIAALAERRRREAFPRSLAHGRQDRPRLRRETPPRARIRGERGGNPHDPGPRGQGSRSQGKRLRSRVSASQSSSSPRPCLRPLGRRLPALPPSAPSSSSSPILRPRAPRRGSTPCGSPGARATTPTSRPMALPSPASRARRSSIPMALSRDSSLPTGVAIGAGHSPPRARPPSSRLSPRARLRRRPGSEYRRCR